MLFLQVAVKKMKKKFSSWDECMNLREVKVISLSFGCTCRRLKMSLWQSDLFLFFSHCEDSTTRILWSWKKSSGKMTNYFLFLNIWWSVKFYVSIVFPLWAGIICCDLFSIPHFVGVQPVSDNERQAAALFRVLGTEVVLSGSPGFIIHAQEWIFSSWPQARWI